MVNNISFYKIYLELDSKKTNNKINLMDRTSEIIEAKDRFNTKFSGSKALLILNLTQNSIHLILRLDNNISVKNVNIRILQGFIAILKNDFNWKSSLAINTQKLFSAKIVKKLDPLECKQLVANSSCEISELLNSSVDKSLFLDLDEEETKDSLKEMEEDGVPIFEEGHTESLDIALKEVEAIRGSHRFKNEITDIVRYTAQFRRINADYLEQYTGIFPFHYIFKGKNGTNMLQGARLLTEVFFHLGLIKSRKLVRLDLPDISNNYTGVNFEGNVNESDTGVVYVENIFDLDEEIDENKVFKKLAQKMQQLRGKLIIILSCYVDEKDPSAFKRLMNTLNPQINVRQVEYTFYEPTELSEMIQSLSSIKGYTVNKPASDLIINNLKKWINDKDFETESFIQQHIDRAIFEKNFKALNFPGQDLKEILTLDMEDFHFLAYEDSQKAALTQEDVFTELDTMIGLEEVKERVKQIYNVLKVRLKKKQMGLESHPVCLHMEFTGNPGTGKTTVARIMGVIFKKLGFLSTGHFTELTRDDLIGPYIGQTTPKVKKALKAAKGGIMFIDEAYNLVASYDNDFGYEAVAELVKGMEDLKDDLVVIFAGYPKEMEKMVNSNPGLRDRIAFKIEYPDFSVEELSRIFQKMCKDRHYVLTDEALVSVEGLINQLHKSKKENFGNARVMRKLFERVEIIQNNRICLAEAFNRDEIQMILIDDVVNLYKDKEIEKLLKEQGQISKIGF